MAYIPDPDLDFLADLDDGELELLFRLLAYDSKGSPRISQGITRSREFKQHGEHYSRYWRLLGEELQRFGGNTLVNVFRRGRGVLYHEILVDVCARFLPAGSWGRNDPAEKLEHALLTQELGRHPAARGGGEDLQAVCARMDRDDVNTFLENLSPATEGASRAGRYVAFYALGRLLARRLGGPAAVGAAAADLAGPAWRVTVPAVFLIAILRLRAGRAEAGSSRRGGQGA